MYNYVSFGVLKTPFARSFAVHSCARLVGAAKHGLQALSQSAISCIRRRSCGSHLLRETAALYAGRAPELVEGAARHDRSRSQVEHIVLRVIPVVDWCQRKTAVVRPLYSRRRVVDVIALCEGITWHTVLKATWHETERKARLI